MINQVRRSSINWGKGFSLLLIFVLMLLLAPMAQAADPIHAHPGLLKKAKDNPNEIVRVIVQKKVADDGPEKELKKNGGNVKKDLRLINGFAAEMSAKDVEKLSKHPGVKYISFDAPMFSSAIDTTDTAQSLALPPAIPAPPVLWAMRDEFTTVSYAGNNGTANWASSWVDGETTIVNLSPQKDTYIANSGSTNYGTCQSLGVANTTLGIIRRPLYRFDLSSIPVSATIVSANMSLYTYFVDKAPTTVNAHRVTSDWDEGTACAGTGIANWNNRKSGTAWTTAGGDFDSAVAASVNVNTTSAGTYSFALTSLVQNWVNGTYPNYGVLLNRPVVSGGGEVSWRPREWTTSGQKPNLQITYRKNDGGSAGNIKVATGTNCASGTGNCLSVSNTNVGDYVYRTANLSNATSATLTLWRNNQLAGLNNNDSVVLEVSSNGSTWTPLRTWKDISGDVGAANESFDLTPYISATTSIRFRVATRTDNGNVNFDNIQIQYTTLANTYNRAIGVDKLWTEAPYLDGQGITVAVVDSGFGNNADLQVYGGGNSRVITSATPMVNTVATNDGYGHGTHVAGIIGGNGNGSNGQRVGVAPAVNLINVKVSNDQGAALASDMIHGLQWINDNRTAYNIKVVNISMNSSVYESYQVSALDAAVEILWFNKIVVIVSAGNNGTTTLYPPANDPFVITVGAVDDKGTASIGDDAMTAFSAYGTTSDGFAKPDLVAPGKDVISLLASTNSGMYVNHPNNRVNSSVFRASGTSMSTPMVTGAVALLLQDEPTLNPDQVKYRLKATANKSWAGYSAAQAGAGYLDAYAAIHGTTTQNANTGIAASQLLTTGTNPINWGSVDWGSVDWGSVDWGSVDWGSVDWGSITWGSDYWGP